MSWFCNIWTFNYQIYTVQMFCITFKISHSKHSDSPLFFLFCLFFLEKLLFFIYRWVFYFIFLILVIFQVYAGRNDLPAAAGRRVPALHRPLPAPPRHLGGDHRSQIKQIRPQNELGNVSLNVMTIPTIKSLNALFIRSQKAGQDTFVYKVIRNEFRT